MTTDPTAIDAPEATSHSPLSERAMLREAGPAEKVLIGAMTGALVLVLGALGASYSQMIAMEARAEAAERRAEERARAIREIAKSTREVNDRLIRIESVVENNGDRLERLEKSEQKRLGIPQ